MTKRIILTVSVDKLLVLSELVNFGVVTVLKSKLFDHFSPPWVKDLDGTLAVGVFDPSMLQLWIMDNFF